MALNQWRGDDAAWTLTKIGTVRIVSFPHIVIFEAANPSALSIPECHDGGEQQSRGVLQASLF